MKKALSIMFALLLLFLLPACGGEEEEDDGDTPSGGDGGNNEGNGGWMSQEGQDGKILNTRTKLIRVLAIGPDDTIYIGGETEDNLYSELQGKRDAFLVAFNSEGEELWGKQWNVGGKGEDYVFRIIVDNEGYLYISGGTSESYYIMKFASNGTKIWEQISTFGQISSLALDAEKNVYVAHRSSGEIIKYSTNGNELKQYNIPNSTSNQLNTISIDSEGNIYAGGYTMGTLFAENAGSLDAFLVKLAPDGTQQWGKQWGATKQDIIENIEIDKQNNIYVVGYTDNKDSEIFSKFDSDGNKIWGYAENYIRLAICDKTIYTVKAGHNNGKIDQYNLNGEHIGSTAIVQEEGFAYVGCDSEENVYTLTSNYKIIKFSPSDFK